MKKCIFIDRDGTLNVEKNYLHKIEDFEWEKGALEALKIFNELDYKVVVVTNQAGVAKGYYGEKEVNDLHEYIKMDLDDKKLKIDGFYYCPHHPDGIGEYKKECNCRKPGILNFEKAREEHGIEYKGSFMVGDRISDLESALRLGMTPVLVKTGYGAKEVDKIYFKSKVYDNLLAFALDLKNGVLK